jgi:uncharacterized protein YidB (DUF937 family)
MLADCDAKNREGAMGLLDNILGQVLGGMAQGNARAMPSRGGLGGAGTAAIIGIALELLRRNGGLDGVLGRMRAQGHASEADSWVGTGQNLPISPDVLSQIFGREEVGRTARDLGVDPDEALGGLASVFPEVVDQMTPQGRVDSGSDDLVERALQDLEQRRR